MHDKKIDVAKKETGIMLLITSVFHICFNASRLPILYQSFECRKYFAIEIAMSTINVLLKICLIVSAIVHLFFVATFPQLIDKGYIAKKKNLLK